MAMPQVEGVVNRTPSPELLSSPDANGETEASLSQRWSCLLLPPCAIGREDGPSVCLPLEAGLQLGAGLTQTPHPWQEGPVS